MPNYPTNVSNSQWQIISKFLDVERNRKYELRQILNAILYLVKTGVSGECCRLIFQNGPLHKIEQKEYMIGRLQMVRDLFFLVVILDLPILMP